MHGRPLTRRDFLVRSAVGAGGLALGCSGNGSTGTSATGTTPRQFDHLVVVTMENRSFDHLLGWLPGADGVQAGKSYPDRDGVLHPTFHLTQPHGCGYAGPTQSFTAGRVQYHDGECDGWLVANRRDLFSIGYFEAADLSFLGQAAPQWTVLDRYFSAVMGPTLPNRLVMLAGQTDRIWNSPDGCDLPTILDRLAAAGLAARNYGSFLEETRIFGTRYDTISFPSSQFFQDAAAGQLPNVAFLDPVVSGNGSGNSDHAPDDIRNGEAFLGSVYDAVVGSPNWPTTVLLVTYDEWGGFYDHVPPPVAPIPAIERQAGNGDGLRGFRVPALLISPFAARGRVSSVVYDHASIPKLIESRWGLAPLSDRDAQANDLAGELDLGRFVPGAPTIVVPQGPFAVPCLSESRGAAFSHPAPAPWRLAS